MDEQIIERAIDAAARARSNQWSAETIRSGLGWTWDELTPEDQAKCIEWVTPIITAALAEVEASLTAELRELRKESARLQADAWDACVVAATGGGLTQLAGILRDDNPFREAIRGESE